jgi:tetratricopeptide (TPR) repeat protein
VSNLIAAYGQLGRYDKARTVLEAYLKRDPNSVTAHRALGRFFVIAGQFTEAQRESDTALLLAPRLVSPVLLKGDIALLRGDFAASEREYLSSMDQAAEADEQAVRLRLGMLYLTEGRVEKALAQVRASIAAGTTPESLGWVELEAGRPDLAVVTFRAYLANPGGAPDLRDALYARSGLGLSYVATGNIGKARQALEDLKACPEGVFGKAKQRFSLVLTGALATQRGDGRTAIADLEQAVAGWPYPVDYSSRRTAALGLLARAYEAAGDLAKARETYEKIAALTTGRLAFGATYTRSFYHLGLIAERQGDKARAREQFQTFLELRKDADKGLPDIADARKRTAQ